MPQPWSAPHVHAHGSDDRTGQRLYPLLICESLMRGQPATWRQRILILRNSPGLWADHPANRSGLGIRRATPRLGQCAFHQLGSFRAHEALGRIMLFIPSMEQPHHHQAFGTQREETGAPGGG